MPVSGNKCTVFRVLEVVLYGGQKSVKVSASRFCNSVTGRADVVTTAVRASLSVSLIPLCEGDFMAK